MQVLWSIVFHFFSIVIVIHILFHILFSSRIQYSTTTITTYLASTDMFGID